MGVPSGFFMMAPPIPLISPVSASKTGRGLVRVLGLGSGLGLGLGSGLGLGLGLRLGLPLLDFFVVRSLPSRAPSPQPKP